jgi:hypothetical protein
VGGTSARVGKRRRGPVVGASGTGTGGCRCVTLCSGGCQGVGSAGPLDGASWSGFDRGGGEGGLEGGSRISACGADPFRGAVRVAAAHPLGQAQQVRPYSDECRHRVHRPPRDARGTAGKSLTRLLRCTLAMLPRPLLTRPLLTPRPTVGMLPPCPQSAPRSATQPRRCPSLATVGSRRRLAASAVDFGLRPRCLT